MPSLQILLPVFQRDQLLEGRAVVFHGVATPALSAGAYFQRGETARPMIVEIGIEMGGVKDLKLLGVLGRDRGIADVLANDRAILALHQSVVGGAIGPGFGELY